ncbi:MAG TPA: hypothetical protein VMD51_12650 [Mycobacterium sp.]|nr:hypothetical protein [Mycobacterium sp.]
MRALVFGAAAAAALVAGCTSSPPPSGPPTTISPAPTTASVAPAEHGSLAHCLQEHGVSEAGGSMVLGAPAGVDQKTWDDAIKACSTLAPGPGPGN